MNLSVPVVLFMFVSMTSALAADNLVGTWKLNLAKSKYGSASAPKSVISHYEAVEGGIKEVVDRVDADGKSVHIEWTVKYDGRDYPVIGDPVRDSIAVKKIDDYTYELIGKKNGETTTTRIVIARDGKSRTLTTTGTRQGQKVAITTVYEKQ